MLHAQKDREEDTTPEHDGLFSREDQRKNENAIEEAIVLKVNMINDQQSGGEND